MDFTEAYSNTCSAAGYAVKKGNVELLKTLIQKGYSLDIADNRGWCPIHEAATHKSLRCLRLLIHAATEKGDIAVAKTLLKHGARINGPHSACLWSVLHQAAYQEHLEILKLLLEKGADKEARDDYGITPLFLAAQYGKQESLRVLLQHGSDVNCQAFDKATPLFIAAQEGHVECVELLLSNGADANLYCSEDDWQLPIHAAAQMGKVKFFAIVYILLQAGAVVTGLHYCYCLQYQCFHLLQFLLTQGYTLPSGSHLADVVKYGLLSEHQYKQWLPLLLLAGLNPVDLLSETWLNTASDNMLNFTLEFTNWKRLPSIVEQILLCRRANSTWVHQKYFDDIPSLTHLCRLKIRSTLKSEFLRSDKFIRQLPLPVCLHDFLLYKEILKLYGVPEISENQEEIQREHGYI